MVETISKICFIVKNRAIVHTSVLHFQSSYMLIAYAGSQRKRSSTSFEHRWFVFRRVSESLCRWSLCIWLEVFAINHSDADFHFLFLIIMKTISLKLPLAFDLYNKLDTFCHNIQVFLILAMLGQLNTWHS